MGYMASWLHFNSGDEAPPVFWRWAGLSLLAASCGRKFWTFHGKFPVTPSLYVGLIGSPASGKSTAKGEAKKIFLKAFPELKVSASIQSREHIIKMMGQDDCIVRWQNNTVTGVEDEQYRPFYIIANEFSSFLGGADMQNMLDFLVDIYDENWYSSGFKNTGSDSFTNPYVNVLACTVPSWFLGNLRQRFFDGGLGRRMILVVAERTQLIAEPFRPKDWILHEAKVISHLQHLNDPRVHGEFVKTEAARKWFREWYENDKRLKDKADDPILSQFEGNKHIPLHKVAMLVAMDEMPLRFEITDEHFQVALSLLDALEPKIAKLTSGIGKNDIAGVGILICEAVRSNGGAMLESAVKARFFRDMPGFNPGGALEQLLTQLHATGQLVRTMPKDPIDGISRSVLFTPDRFKRYESDGHTWKKD